jgi:hypothetical protein
MPRTSGNCWANRLKKTFNPTSVWRAKGERTSRSISDSGCRFSVCGMLLASWIEAILEASVSGKPGYVVAMWQFWHDWGVAPPSRKSLNTHSG